MRQYDFAGWATKNDIRCTDGVTIRHGAFKHQNEVQVPLVWQHNTSDPKNVLGNVILKHKDQGVYAYGKFNETEEAVAAKELLRHGDIRSLSIGANKVKRRGNDVVHGRIYEVSLVLAGANPGALIETVMQHADNEEESIVLFTDTLIHSAEDELFDDEEKIEHKEEVKDMSNEKTVGDIIKSLNEEQMMAVEYVIGSAIQNMEEGEEEMKQNIFSNMGEEQQEGHLTHGELLADAKQLGSLKDAYLEHGITNVEVLFPEAHNLDKTPSVYNHLHMAAEKIVNGTTKSPFSRIKNQWADITPAQMRARGYMKGSEKFEQQFSILNRSINPQTIYVKQKIDRDDVIDITDFDVVAFMQRQMRVKLYEELAMAIMVGDGRLISDADKIKEDHVKPIIKDDSLYTIKKTAKSVDELFEVFIKAFAEYRGAGAASLFIDPIMLADLKLLRVSDTDNRFLFGDIPTNAAIAAKLGVAEIVEVSWLPANTLVAVNLSDYTVGSTRGGQVTSFEDFDIDYNQHKYLMETRLCGMLTTPKSAIVVEIDPAGE